MILLHLPKNPIFTTVYISHIWAEIRKRTDINFKQATSLSVKGQQCHAIKLAQAAYMVSAIHPWMGCKSIANYFALLSACSGLWKELHCERKVPC